MALTVGPRSRGLGSPNHGSRPHRSGARPAHDRRQAGRPRAALRRGRARRVGPRGREAARQGQDDRPRADQRAARPRFVRRIRRVRAAPLEQLRHGEEPSLRRRRGHRRRHRRRPSGVRVQPGRDRVRRRARRGVRREDRQGARLRDEDRLPGRRHQRRRRRPHPGRRRLARPLRRDLPPDRPCVRRHPADLADHGRGRGWARLLPRPDRLHRDGRQDVADVHHRPGRREDGDRRGGDARGTGRCPHAQHDQRQRPLPRRRRGRRDQLRQGVCCPTCRRTTSIRYRCTTPR